MSSPASASEQAISGSEKARAFMDNPLGYFGCRFSDIQSLPRDEMFELQNAALSIRFDEQRAHLPMLTRLADRQGITSVSKPEDVVPLLFEHTMYKSYPMSLLEKQDFGRLTAWLNKLTSSDLSNIDASGCQSIDDWLDFLESETDLDPATSAGTTGTMSFIPKGKKDWNTTIVWTQIFATQEFGKPADLSLLDAKYHVIWPTFRDGHTGLFRTAHYLAKMVAKGDPSHFHALYDSVGSADLMWLAARLRAATAKGELDSVTIPKPLLAKRAELEAMSANGPERQKQFLDDLIAKLRGERVYAAGVSNLYFDVASRGIADGLKNVFASDSILSLGGGAKGVVLPDDWQETVKAFSGVNRIQMTYGMTEINGFAVLCDHGRYHFPPWVIPILLDAETSKPLPRTGVQSGRAAYFDVSVESFWGGIITGDAITIDWDRPCPCGQTTLHIDPQIRRFSEISGESDKISCAASPQAHGEAMDFLTAFEG